MLGLRGSTRVVLIAMVAIGVSGAIGGCGGRSSYLGERFLTDAGSRGDGSAATDAGVGNDAATGTDGGQTVCHGGDPCVVAVRTDNCCEAAYPEVRSRVSADPCLELWPPPWSTIPQLCFERYDPECALIDCAPLSPPSRLATCTPHGSCQFADECRAAADCALGLDWRACCPCPTAVPRELIDLDPCLTLWESNEGPGAGCSPPACPAIPCEPCGIPTATCSGDPPQCRDAF